MRSRLLVRLALGTLLAVCFLLPEASVQAASAAVPSRFTTPTVFAFYYDWYSAPPVTPGYGHWNGGDASRPAPSQNITSDSFPTLGAYDSSTASVIRQHMAWMKAARIDVVVLDWWGQGSREDTVAKRVMDGAAAARLKVSFLIDSYAGATPSSLSSDISYIYRKYGSHPAFYRVSRPTKYGPSAGRRGVFMVYNPPAPLQNSAQYASWMDRIRGTANDAIVLVRTDDRLLLSDASLRQYLGALHFDGMFNYGVYGKTAYARSLPQSNDYILLFATAPGFDNSRAAGVSSPTVVPRKNGATYDEGWSTLISRRPEWISIVSFNEWHETTQIEPARTFSYGGFSYLNYEGAYGLHGAAASNAYITRTAFWAQRFKGSSTPVPSASPSPTSKPSPKPTSKPAAPAISIPSGPVARGIELALILVVVGGGLVLAAVMMRRRRQ